MLLAVLRHEGAEYTPATGAKQPKPIPQLNPAIKTQSMRQARIRKWEFATSFRRNSRTSFRRDSRRLFAPPKNQSKETVVDLE